MTTAVGVGVIEGNNVSDKKWPEMDMDDVGNLHSRDTDY